MTGPLGILIARRAASVVVENETAVRANAAMNFIFIRWLDWWGRKEKRCASELEDRLGAHYLDVGGFI